MNRALTPNILTPADLEPHWKWEGRIPAWGHTSVDFERRIEPDQPGPQGIRLRLTASV